MLWCDAPRADVKFSFPQQAAETETTVGENVKSHGPVLWDRYLDIHIGALKKYEGRCSIVTLINKSSFFMLESQNLLVQEAK